MAETIEQAKAETWKEAAALVRSHKAGVSTFGGEEARAIEIALFHLAKEMDEKAGQLSESPDDSLYNPVRQVFFRAGLIACREYMARFVEAQDPAIAASIRANWWPQLGEDFGPPRQLAFGELTEGEYGTPEFRCKEAGEVSPTLEALPVALGFLLTCQPGKEAA